MAESFVPERGGERRSSKRRLRAGLAVAAVASLGATAVVASSFAPFPEPAVGPFPDTDGMRLASQLVPDEIGAVTSRGGVLVNDIWGWTSPSGHDYALVGTGDGMSVVRVTDPVNPEFLGMVPTPLPASFANLWGDVAVFDADDGSSYAYFTTEAAGAGISILALDQLDAMGPAPSTSHIIPASATWEEGGYESAHNIYVNQDSGFAYVAGVDLHEGPTACDGEPFHPARFNALILDLGADPLAPAIAACRADAAEHDFYVVDYHGVDDDYKGREIAFVFDGRERDARNGDRPDDTPGEIVGGMTEIWDVTDKDDIEVIASFSVPNLCFSHQGWTSSQQHEFLLINDELDEIRDAEAENGFFRNNFCGTDLPPGTPSQPSLYVMNIRDLDNPILQERFHIDAEPGNDHNFMRRGNKLYWAVYTAGTRVLKMKDKQGDLQIEEIARLDSEPRDVPLFFGQWGIYAFESGTIVASDIVNGLMVMQLGD